MESTLITDFTPEMTTLAVAFELSKASWKIGLHDSKREHPAMHTVADEAAQKRLEQAVAVIEETKQKWGLAQPLRVVVMYEAGQDGFWIARALIQLGYEALVIDPASIPVERHARRAKTDRLDTIKLLTCLRAWLRGERDRMHVIRIPESAAEAQRQLVRDRGELQKECGQHRDRIRKLLRTVGCWDSMDSHFARRLADGDVRCHDGSALAPELQQRLRRESVRMELAEQQLLALEKALVKQLPESTQERIATLTRLKAIGKVGAMRIVLELFWRDFDNRRQVGSCVGLVPQPYDSGESHIDQGISKQGNRRVRALLVEMAWMWLRYQPESALTRWFDKRTQGSGPNKRARRIAIIAVARRLVIALWRYLKDGVIPDGATLKAA
ncbi:IS110 family RNA-guided transposase [Undibacterium parvum]|uniref:IS110 family transposase n=1 Tax=Undibacterium parvum TaxID=401471 RepID=A0A3S9HJI2_9BURK|nr:IS110 family transposase [Undibacterium parvum]AZP12244.1 IS110 family transposase [Undibacterium parvum]